MGLACALVSAIVSGLDALMLTQEDQLSSPATEVERVACSRRTMEEMLRGSRTLGSMRDGVQDGL